MKNTVLGIFSESEQAEVAIQALNEAGFSSQDISILMKDKIEHARLAQSTGAKVAEGTLQGATTGGVAGALAGLLIGVGAVTVPGIGALLVGGPLAVALGLSGAAALTVEGAVTGALAGGMVGALVGLGVSPEVAKVYEERIKSGAVLIAVPVKERNADEVKDILHEHHADQISVITA